MIDLLTALKVARDELVDPSRGPSGSRPVVDQINVVIHDAEMRRLGDGLAFDNNVQRVPLTDRDMLLQEALAALAHLSGKAAYLAGRAYAGLGRNSRTDSEDEVIAATRAANPVREHIAAALAAGTSDGAMAEALKSLLADEDNAEIQAAKDRLFRVAPEIPTVARIALRIHKTGA